MKKIIRHCLVSGIVQGVFYRQNTLQQALQYHITGWVKNLADGRVEAILIGTEESVLSMLEWMAVGPEKAVVTSLEVSDPTDVNIEAYKNFEIIQ